MLQGTILNIQKFSIHDGPGIRTTVFFKGCTLRCTWCHNPESIRFERQLMYSKEKCTHCQGCNRIYDGRSARWDTVNGGFIESALESAHSGHTAIPLKKIELVQLHEPTSNSDCSRKFVDAEQAVDKCLPEALEIAGKYYTSQEIIKEVLKDRLFYEESGGGVTFSGGESIAQIDFLEEVVRGCKEEGLHVAIDTCGYVAYTYFERILPYCDLFLYDIKETDPVTHKEFTGVGNQLILDNLHKLSEAGAKIWLRFPLIKGVNLREDHIEGLLALCKNIYHERVSLLPYHPLGAGKREKLGEVPATAMMSTPSDEKMEELAERFRIVSENVHIGG